MARSDLVPISAEIEEDLRDEIRALAKDADRSFSAEVRRALRGYVQEQRPEPVESDRTDNAA